MLSNLKVFSGTKGECVLSPLCLQVTPAFTCKLEIRIHYVLFGRISQSVHRHIQKDKR